MCDENRKHKNEYCFCKRVECFTPFLHFEIFRLSKNPISMFKLGELLVLTNKKSDR